MRTSKSLATYSYSDVTMPYAITLHYYFLFDKMNKDQNFLKKKYECLIMSRMKDSSMLYFSKSDLELTG